MPPTKVRIYELSKLLDKSNKEIMDYLKSACSLEIKSHASSIDGDVAEKVKAHFSGGRPPAAQSAQPAKETPKPAPAAKAATPTAPAAKPSAPAAQAGQQAAKPPAPRPATGQAPQQQAPAQPGGQPAQPTQAGQPAQPGQAPRQPMPPRPGEARPAASAEGRPAPGQAPRPQMGPPREGQPQRPVGQRPPGERPPGAPGERPPGPPGEQRMGPPRPQRPPGEYPQQQQYSQQQRPPQGKPGMGQRPPGPPGPPGQRPPMGQQQGGAYRAPGGPRPGGPGGPPRQDYQQMGQRPPQQGGAYRAPGGPGGPRPGGPGGPPRHHGGGPRPFPQQDFRSDGPKRHAAPLPPPPAATAGGRTTGQPQRRHVDEPRKGPTEKDVLKKEMEKERPLKLKEKRSMVEELPQEEEVKTVTIKTPVTIRELAALMKKRETELIRHLFMKGVMVNVNQTLEVEDAIKLAEEFEYLVEGPDDANAKKEEKAPELMVKQTKGTNLLPRAPVVSIMGHVDHGKTTLLDAIRESHHKIVDTEAGGITQSIGAYTVETPEGRKIVFIDTPGHEAFTLMRMRGARATDIAILVVAADDGVMPQTIEAINHAKAANIPIVVAVNKVDKAGSDPDKVLAQLSDHGLSAEKWGGDTLTVEVSALKKLGLDDLLETINLVSELQELKADPELPGEGVVIEARLDKGKGPVATVLVQNGTLRVGDNVIIGKVGGRVRALISDKGERLQDAGPSTPVEILGLSSVPHSGDQFEVVKDDKEFKKLLQERQNEDKEQSQSRYTKLASHALFSENESERKDIYLIIKADTQGSLEAVTAALLQLQTEKAALKIIHSGIGDVSENDIMLASANGATTIAFNVKDENVFKAAQDQGVTVRKHNIIYHLIEDVEKLMLGMLTGKIVEKELGQVEVRQLFTVGKKVIAGCMVTEGKIIRNSVAHVFRDGKELFHGPLSQLRRFKDDVKEVQAGYECGISFDKFNDLQEGDVIKVFKLVEETPTSLS